MFTRKRIKDILIESPESRREWILKLLKEAGSKNQKNKEYQVWRQDNHPIELYSNNVIDQKLEYIHDNPVEEGLVENPEDYLYSNARNYSGMDVLMDIDFL